MVAQREDEAIDAYGVAFQAVGISCAIVLLVMLHHALQYFVIRVLLPGEMGVAKFHMGLHDCPLRGGELAWGVQHYLGNEYFSVIMKKPGQPHKGQLVLRQTEILGIGYGYYGYVDRVRVRVFVVFLELCQGDERVPVAVEALDDSFDAGPRGRHVHGFALGI